MSRRALAICCLLGGAVGAFALSGRRWVEGTVQDPVLGPVQVSASGTEAGPAGSALALLVLAAVLAVLLTRGMPRRVALVLTVLAAGALVLVAYDVLADPTSALTRGPLPPVASAVGSVTGATATWAPWATIGTAVLLVCGAVLASRSGPATRSVPVTDAPRGAPSEVARREQARTWDALSQGTDPTDDPPPPVRSR